MSNKRVGIYLGTSSIGAAVMQGKDISLLTRLDTSSLDSSSPEITDTDIRWEALLNKVLRELGSDIDKVYVSMSDKDFIFRSLEMPLMKRSEIESSLDFEIEKYIPFKMEELEWDFEFVRMAKERKLNLSFIGIRENNLRRVRDVFARLSIDLATIEPSCLSLARFIKSLKQYTKLNDFAIIDLTETEAFLTFFQNDLPVFNRYLVTPGDGKELDSNRFGESVDLSFQYFKREFKSYNLEKVLIVGDISNEKLVTSLNESLQAEVEVVSSYELTNRNNAAVENIKALGVASRGLYKTTFEPTFQKTSVVVGEALPQAARIPALKTWLHGTLLGLGLVGSLFLSLIMGNEVTKQQAILHKTEESINIPAPLKDLSWQERKVKTSELEKQVKELSDISKGYKSFYAFFDRISRRGILPEGLWLDKLNFSKVRASGKDKSENYQCEINGLIFRDDDYMEKQGIDELLVNLKNDNVIKSYFPNINLEASNRTTVEGYNLTRFTVNMR